MKLAILGYGKMGKTIERIALERGHEIVLKISSSNASELTLENLSKADAAIEFSVPSQAVENMQMCFNSKVPVVVGTTGWYDKLAEVKKAREKANIGLLTATNFSVGVNLFFELNKKLAELMNPRTEYKASMTEVHHTEKLDSPSGTAITLAEGLIAKHGNYKSWINESSTNNSNELAITALREPDVKGTHTINYESEVDRISIEHFAKNRDGFALGAVLAAEFIIQKSGVFTMKDVLKL